MPSVNPSEVLAVLCDLLEQRHRTLRVMFLKLSKGIVNDRIKIHNETWGLLHVVKILTKVEINSVRCRHRASRGYAFLRADRWK